MSFSDDLYEISHPHELEVTHEEVVTLCSARPQKKTELREAYSNMPARPLGCKVHHKMFQAVHPH